MNRNRAAAIRIRYNVDRSFSNNFTLKEKDFLDQCCSRIDSDGRLIPDFEGFLEYVKSNRHLFTDKDLFHAKVLAETDQELNENKDFHVHHQLPICLFGAILSDENYSFVSPENHLRLHGSICHFLPSSLPHKVAFDNMIPKQAKERGISIEELIENLNDYADIYATANRAARKDASERNIGNKHALKPISIDPKVNAKRKTGRNQYQKRKLRKMGVNVDEDFSSFEHDVLMQSSGMTKHMKRNPGNVFFNNMIEAKFSNYKESSKNMKTILIDDVYHAILKRGNNFLIRKTKDDIWTVMEEWRVRVKIVSAFRSRIKKKNS